MDEKEILSVVLDCLNHAMTAMSDLDDDEAHADIYWEIKDVSDSVMKRIKGIEE